MSRELLLSLLEQIFIFLFHLLFHVDVLCNVN